MQKVEGRRMVLAGLFQARLLTSNVKLNHIQVRKVYWILYAAANKIDEERIKLVGPDRACAEWLLKCGAQVRFHGSGGFISDYNRLGIASGRSKRLAEVKAEEATLMSIGFPHFDGVNSLEKLSFRRCTRFDDSCINELQKYVSGTVKDLEIVSCGDVSDNGLAKLQQFKNLKRLHLFELTGVKRKESAYVQLRTSLPACKIEFQDQNFYMSNTNN